MGVVYQARDRETGEVVAIKVLKPDIAADRVSAERFANEVRLSRRITHKHVCRVYDFSRAGSTTVRRRSHQHAVGHDQREGPTHRRLLLR